DETYIHEARNETDCARIILFCDVERPLRTRFARAINRFACRHVMKHAATKNMPGERVGILNRLFGVLYKVRLVGKKLKAWHRPTYYCVKFSLAAALVWLVFF